MRWCVPHLKVLVLMASVAPSHGCSPDDLREETHGQEPAPSDSIACSDGDGQVKDFDFCIGYVDNPGFDINTGALDINATVVADPLVDFSFRTCAGVYGDAETVYFESDGGNLLKLSFPGERGGEPAFPPGLLPVGDRLRVRLQIPDATGSIALRLDSDAVSVAGTRYGLVVPPVTEFTVARGPADGPPQSVECGTIQQDTFEVVTSTAQHLVAVGECKDIGELMFIGIQAFHPVEYNCSDGLAPLTWVAAWPGHG